MHLVFAADSIPNSLKAIIELLDRSMANIDVYGVEIKKHVSGSDAFLSTNFILNNAKTFVQEARTKYSDSDMESMLTGAYHGIWPFELFKEIRKKAEFFGFSGRYGSSDNVVRFRFYHGKENLFSFDTDKKGASVYFDSKVISKITQNQIDTQMLRAKLEEIDPNAKYKKSEKNFVWLRTRISCLKNESNQKRLFHLLDEIGKAVQ